MTILTLPLPRPVIDTSAFDEAAAHLAGAVAVVAWGGATPRGLVVHTVSVLSMEPARVLFAVDKGEVGHDALLLEQECGISLLAGDDEAEAERFIRHDGAPERFQADRWTVSADAPPRFIGSLVHFSGFIDQKIDAGSHSLFVVRIGAAAVRHRAPLVYFDRGFRQLQPAQVSAMVEA
jgi:flavin reductase (DIM6/NTAB) family NADH-FMN oxidoreductase RutF